MQQVRSAMVVHNIGTAVLIYNSSQRIVYILWQLIYKMYNEAVLFFGIGYVDHFPIRENQLAGIAYLAAALRIKRRFIEYQLVLLLALGGYLAVFDHMGNGFSFIVPGKL